MKLNKSGLQSVRRALAGLSFAAVLIGGEWIIVSRFGYRGILATVCSVWLLFLVAIYLDASRRGGQR